jgi:hypothetical protein
MRRGSEKGRCPLCTEEEDVIHNTLLKCLETGKWREQLLNRKWRIINEEVAYKRIINCTNAVELRNRKNTCMKLDVNRRIKLVIYKWKWGRGSTVIVIRINIV